MVLLGYVPGAIDASQDYREAETTPDRRVIPSLGSAVESRLGIKREHPRVSQSSDVYDATESLTVERRGRINGTVQSE